MDVYMHVQAMQFSFVLFQNRSNWRSTLIDMPMQHMHSLEEVEVIEIISDLFLRLVEDEQLVRHFWRLKM